MLSISVCGAVAGDDDSDLLRLLLGPPHLLQLGLEKFIWRWITKTRSEDQPSCRDSSHLSAVPKDCFSRPTSEVKQKSRWCCRIINTESDTDRILNLMRMRTKITWGVQPMILLRETVQVVPFPACCQCEISFSSSLKLSRNAMMKLGTHAVNLDARVGHDVGVLVEVPHKVGRLAALLRPVQDRVPGCISF